MVDEDDGELGHWGTRVGVLSAREPEAGTTRRDRLLTRLREPNAKALLLVGGLLAASMAVRLVLAGKVLAPQILCDEFVYAELAESFADEGRLLLRGEPSRQSVLYPILVAPAWLADSIPRAYELAKAINVLLVHAGAVIVYAWARRLVTSGWALAAAALTLALPALHLSALLMTENAYLPAFLGASFAIALSLERPTLLRQGIALTAIGVTLAVRSQGVALVAVLVGAILLMAGFDAAAAATARLRAVRDRLVAHWPTGAVVGAGVAVYVIGRQARGSGFLGSFGGVSAATGADYSWADTKRWAMYHLAELTISVAVVPVSALVILLALAVAGRLPRVAERAFVAVASTAIVVMTITVGAFASRFAGSIVERYTFSLAPLLLLALVVWAARGAPRPAVGTALAVVLPVAVVGAWSLEDFYGLNLVPNTFGTFVFFRLGEELDGDVALVADLVLAGAVAGVLCVALLSRRLVRVALPAAVGVFLVASAWSSFGVLEGQARNVRQIYGLPRDQPDWVDRAIGPDADASYLYAVPAGGDATNASTLMLQIGFWNRSVDSVINLASPQICPLPEARATYDPATGSVAAAGGEPLEPAWIVSDGVVVPAGEEVGGVESMRVHEPTRPLRLAARWDGRFVDRWMSGAAVHRRYLVAEQPADVVVTVSRPAWPEPTPPPGEVRVQVGSRIAEPVAIRSGEVRSITLPAPRAPFDVQVQVEPTFVPSDYGVFDGRTLGAQVAVEVRARGS